MIVCRNECFCQERMILSAGLRKRSCASGGEWMTLKWILFVTQNTSTARTCSCVSTEYRVLLLQLMFNLMQPLDFSPWQIAQASSITFIYLLCCCIALLHWRILFDILFSAGFEPFGEHEVNSSWVAVQVISNQVVLSFFFFFKQRCHLRSCWMCIS